MIIWLVSKARNDVVFNNLKPDPVRITAVAADFVAEYNVANASRVSNHAISTPDQMSDECQLKRLFVNAGSFSDGITCWGLCVVDQNENIIFNACKRDQISVDPLMAEAMGLR